MHDAAFPTGIVLVGLLAGEGLAVVPAPAIADAAAGRVRGASQAALRAAMSAFQFFAARSGLMALTPMAPQDPQT